MGCLRIRKAEIEPKEEITASVYRVPAAELPLYQILRSSVVGGLVHMATVPTPACVPFANVPRTKASHRASPESVKGITTGCAQTERTDLQPFVIYKGVILPTMCLWKWKLKEPSSGTLTAEEFKPRSVWPQNPQWQLAPCSLPGSGVPEWNRCLVRSECPFPAEWHLQKDCFSQLTFSNSFQPWSLRFLTPLSQHRP